MKKNKAWKGNKRVLGNLEVAVLSRWSGRTSLSLNLGTNFEEMKGEPCRY